MAVPTVSNPNYLSIIIIESRSKLLASDKRNLMSKTVYYWRGSAEVRQDLLRLLCGRGLEVVQKRTLEEILDDAPKEDPAVLLVDATGGEREASQRVLEIDTTPQLQMLHSKKVILVKYSFFFCITIIIVIRKIASHYVFGIIGVVK